jgi:hypothetical protein
MRYILYFLISFTVIGLIFAPLLSKCIASKTVRTINQPLNKATIDSIASGLHYVINVNDLPGQTTATDIVKWLLSALGGLLTTIIMYFLHKWFPNVFPSKKTRDYLNNDS